jgi:phosphonate transport system substrate-binding protein
MYPKLHTLLKYAVSVIAAIVMLGSSLAIAAANDGSSNRPLRVVLIPADGGTENGTRKGLEPIFNAVSEVTGLHFEIKVGQSYGAVVEAMWNESADIAFSVQ